MNKSNSMLKDLILLILQENMQKSSNREASEFFMALANQKLYNMLNDQRSDFSDIYKMLLMPFY
jgi:hypothetical protein